jgi:transcriptional regulator with XRE-family HTH domain
MSRVEKALEGLSYSEIARETGTTTGYISLLFRGQRSARSETLAKIAKVLKVSLDDLHQYLTVKRRSGASASE